MSTKAYVLVMLMMIMTFHSRLYQSLVFAHGPQSVARVDLRWVVPYHTHDYRSGYPRLFCDLLNETYSGSVYSILYTRGWVTAFSAHLEEYTRSGVYGYVRITASLSEAGWGMS